jgi:hypothetical protein
VLVRCWVGICSYEPTPPPDRQVRQALLAEVCCHRHHTCHTGFLPPKDASLLYDDLQFYVSRLREADGVMLVHIVEIQQR